MKRRPSQVDTFDQKTGTRSTSWETHSPWTAHRRATGAAYRSPFKFKKSTAKVDRSSEVVSHVGEMIDDVCRRSINAMPIVPKSRTLR